MFTKRKQLELLEGMFKEQFEILKLQNEEIKELQERLDELAQRSITEDNLDDCVNDAVDDKFEQDIYAEVFRVIGEEYDFVDRSDMERNYAEIDEVRALERRVNYLEELLEKAEIVITMKEVKDSENPLDDQKEPE